MFTYFKELFSLVKLLFSSNPTTVDRLDIVKYKYFPFKGYLAMAWCGKLITRTPEKITEKTVNHEKIHLYQAKHLGSWWKYYLTYLWLWIKGCPIEYPAESAYYTIPFEVEAFANEDNYTYCDNYTGENLTKKYTFEHRRKKYLEVGGLPNDWRKYVKTL